MKVIIVTALFGVLFQMLVFGAETVAELAAQYRKGAKEATTKIDEILQTQGAQIVADRAAKGDKDGAARVADQIQAKLRGNPVPEPDVSLTALFLKYENARLKALEPIKASTLEKIDRSLKQAAKGDMKAGVALAELRNEVEHGRIGSAESPASSMIPEKWDYFSNAEMKSRSGVLTFNSDGTLILDGHTITKGTWKQAGQRSILDVTLFPGDKEERAKIILQGETALFERPFGTRYLKVQK